MINLEKTLTHLGACSSVRSFYKDKSLKTAWNTCTRDADMWWFIQKLWASNALSEKTYDRVYCAYMYGARMAKKFGNSNAVETAYPTIDCIGNACRSIRLVVSYRTILRAVNKL